MQKSMFFIAICPPHRIEKDIHSIKEEFHQKHGTKGAFRSKAHITLQMPFRLSENKGDFFLAALHDVMKTQTAIQIDLNGFGNFEPRVVYINVRENPDLTELQTTIEKFMKQFQVFSSTHKNNGFNPHITVAFRDLKKPAFYEIWEEVKERPFQAEFLAEYVTVFKHNGKSWDVFKEIKFGDQ